MQGGAPNSEFALITRLLEAVGPPRESVVVGAGDDAAVVRIAGDVCITIDVLVDGVHFDRALSAPADVGWKAVAVNVSDIAAMAARPVAAVVGLTLPPSWPVEDAEKLYQGVAAACERWELDLVGGDTVSGPAMSIAIAALGEVPAHGAVRRSGGRAGDQLVVVGALGAAATALAQQRAGIAPDPALLDAHRRPVALPGAGTVLGARAATALIDISDGLGADLGHVCRASGVRARVDASRLPVAPGVAEAAAAAGVDLWPLVCGGGEDFALLAAVPPTEAEGVAAAAAAAEGVPASVVGELLPPDNDAPLVAVTLPDGEVLDAATLGYDHYA